MSEGKQTICVDFDGVLHRYEGWTGPVPKNEPVACALEAIKILAEKYRVVVFTTRGQFETVEWLRLHGFYDYIDFVTDKKPPCVCIVDDLAVCFRGDWGRALVEIEKFRAYWEPEGERVL